MVPAVTWKLVVVAPAATVAEPGRVRTPVGLAATASRVPPAGAAFEMVAVQVVELEDINDVAAQVKEERETAEAKAMFAVLETPLRVAVTIAD